MSIEVGLAALSLLIGQVGLLGATCLIALHLADRNVGEDELLAIVHVNSLSTLRIALRGCEIHDYASCVKRQPKSVAFWHITTPGRALVAQAISLAGLPGGFPPPADSSLIASASSPAAPVVQKKNFFSGASSSSSDQIDRSGSNQIDQIEEEEDESEKIFKAQDDEHLVQLLDAREITGPRRLELEQDRWVTYQRARHWFDAVDRMQQSGFKFRRSKDAYAAACLLNHDEPPDPWKR